MNGSKSQIYVYMQKNRIELNRKIYFYQLKKYKIVTFSDFFPQVEEVQSTYWMLTQAIFEHRIGAITGKQIKYKSLFCRYSSRIKFLCTYIITRLSSTESVLLIFLVLLKSETRAYQSCYCCCCLFACLFVRALQLVNYIKNIQN